MKRRAARQRVRGRHLRVCKPSPTRTVPHSSSSPALLLSKKVSDTASTQYAPAASTKCLLSNCDRHRQPDLLVFDKLLQVCEGPSRRQRPSYSTNKNLSNKDYEARSIKQQLLGNSRRAVEQPNLVHSRACPKEEVTNHNDANNKR